MKQRYNTKEEEDAMDWIERVTGREVNNFHEHLKSGRTLCELVNAIRPGAVKRINTKSSPIADRVGTSLLSHDTHMRANRVPKQTGSPR